MYSHQIMHNKFHQNNHSLKKFSRTTWGPQCNSGTSCYRHDFVDSHGLVFQQFNNRIYYILQMKNCCIYIISCSYYFFVLIIDYWKKSFWGPWCLSTTCFIVDPPLGQLGIKKQYWCNFDVIFFYVALL